MTAVASPTESRNPATLTLDIVDTAGMLRMFLSEDAAAVAAVAAAVPHIAQVVDVATERLGRGGTVHYFGAGASGRLAVLDATEMTPTFGVDPRLFTAHFPGGTTAFADSTIDLEDAEMLGYDDAGCLDADSVAIGITASGSTAYVGGALRRARELDAITVLVACNPLAPLRDRADICVIADTGPEALMGSTRLKAGTATKVILNALSTALMVRAGHTYSNLMVGLTATNDKLRERAVAILVEGSSKSDSECRAALEATGGAIQPALISLISGCPPATAEDLFRRTGSVRGGLALAEEQGW